MAPGEQNDKIFLANAGNFASLARDNFRFQYENNPLYKTFSDALGFKSSGAGNIEKFPYLPIGFFKTHSIRATAFQPQAIFESSGTTGMEKSRHPVKDLSLYEKSFVKGFELFYGPVNEYCILGLLPSYLERGNSSLVFMTDRLIGLSGHPASGFYLSDYDKLITTLARLERERQKTILIGVTFALLDLAEMINAEKKELQLKNTIIMETGGMKGRRNEMIREEVHEILKKSFNIPDIHSEYGMTELLSQAYSKGDGLFYCPPWMKVLVRDEEDPSLVKPHGPGLMNIIDLANFFS